jgi:DNA-binding transcriptional LysR family regulator
MNTIDVSKIDLNLLTALELLLTTQSVTIAAKRAGVTQSSMSHTLRRLRLLFEDELLVRAGRGAVITPRGEALLRPLQQALQGLQLALNGEPRFEPKTSRRTFVIACPDLLGALLPTLLPTLQARAPHTQLEIRPLPIGELSTALADGSLDVVLCPAPCEGSGLMQRTLGAISWCVLARKKHPALKKKLTAKVWGQYPHVMVRSGRDTPNRVSQAASAERVSREIGLVVPGFLLAMYAVASSDLFFTAPRELVTPLAASLSLAVTNPPVHIPQLDVLLVWHERVNNDPGHRWFRALLVEIFTAKLMNKRGPATRGD